MPRYFLEVAYKGEAYSGFQTQKNANSVQQEIEKAFRVLQRETVVMTGSSRTDAGVHALQNFFHFDFDGAVHPQFLYKINAILPQDIVIHSIKELGAGAHCRFDATGREYRYYIYQRKDPFLSGRAFYFPYKLDLEIMQQAAELVKRYHDFTSFSKRNTQVKSFICQVSHSEWYREGDCLVYRVVANRFLRGMVRALTATMLKLGRQKISLEDFSAIIEAKDCRVASFAVPPHGLFLVRVNYPPGYYNPEPKKT